MQTLALQLEAIQEGDKGAKVPPVLDKQGQLQPALEDSKLEYESIKDVGIWTCYHATHIKVWAAHTESQQKSMLRAAGGDCWTVIPQRRKTRAVSATQSASSLN